MLSEKIQTISERVDDVPVIVHWLLKMQVHTILEEVLPEPHGNRQGLSFGKLAVLFLTYMLTQYDHRMCPVEGWVQERTTTLERSTGWTIGRKDATDDRLEDLLDVLGAAGTSETPPAAEAIEEVLGRHVIQAYHLPTEVGRIDTTNFAVYHRQAGEEAPYTLMQFGHSKDHRPDLRQFVEALGTLDPCGVPLVTATFLATPVMMDSMCRFGDGWRHR